MPVDAVPELEAAVWFEVCDPRFYSITVLRSYMRQHFAPVLTQRIAAFLSEHNLSMCSEHFQQ